MTHHIDIDTLTLSHGNHSNRAAGTCLLEAVAWWAEEEHSDSPQCVSPVLAAFGRAWNDGMRSNEERATLKTYIPMLIGTAGNPKADERRSWMAMDWLIRVHAVAWLRLAGGDCAVHAATLAALPAILNSDLARQYQPVLGAAWSAAWSAARSADWSAAWSAAWSADWSADWSAAESALEPTVIELQASAHDLYRRMIEVRQ